MQHRQGVQVPLPPARAAYERKQVLRTLPASGHPEEVSRVLLVTSGAKLCNAVRTYWY